MQGTSRWQRREQMPVSKYNNNQDGRRINYSQKFFSFRRDNIHRRLRVPSFLVFDKITLEEKQLRERKRMKNCEENDTLLSVTIIMIIIHYCLYYYYYDGDSEVYY